MRAKRRLQFVVVIALLPACPIYAAARPGKGEAARLLQAVRSSVAAEDLAVVVRDVEIEMGLGTLVIDEGVLVPAAPVEGRTLEVAFVGDAWFRFSTPDPVEYRNLQVFTGDTSLHTPVSHAVLVTGSEEIFHSILAGNRATGPTVREAVKVFKGWVEGAERQGFAADLSMVKTLMGDPQYRGYIAVWCRSPEHGDFYYIVDPSETEPVTVGQFVPIDLSGFDVWEQRRIKNIIHLFKFFGRFADFSVEHPGRWDTWVSTTAQPPAKAQSPGAGVPEPEHYTLDLYVNPAIELDAKGSARIRLRTGTAGARSVAFSLYPGVRVTAVSGSNEEPLDFIRREGALHVFLEEPVPPGATFEVRIDYEGDLVETFGEESFALLDTQGWYPHAGEVDRATYDVTLRRPRRFTMVASGRSIASGEEDGVAWERRSLELPAMGFTFELGYFDIVRERAGHVELSIGFPRGSSGPGEEARKAIIDTVKRCVPYFEEKFGPYPLDFLTVVTVDRGLSQGMLSMVTLAESVMRGLDDVESPQLREWAEEKRALLIAHEVSHQWWGNWVGWAGYRDQWLSEALAEYSALQFGTGTASSKAAFLARHGRDWRRSLMATTSEGRTVASLGPVTLGGRLDSSKASAAYQAIVYDKGAVVFRMLARQIGEEPFGRMLGELARAVANRTLDTATFLEAIERMSGSDLALFAEQFVYGTGIPDVYYRYTSEPAEDGKGWAILGEARQVGSGHESLRIARDAAGAWTFERRRNVDVDVPTSTLVVPFQVVVTPPEQVKTVKPGEVQSARGFGGRMLLKGHHTPFRLTVPDRPERLELDQLGEVLAIFHDEGWTPKRTLRLQALDLAASGEPDAAERALRQALEAPAYSERAIAWMSEKQRKELDQEEQARFEDARIHTVMARLLIDRGDLHETEKEILAAEKLLEEPEEQAGWQERLRLRSRLDLARGDAEAAYQRLKKGLQSWWLDGEGYAILAVAASESGHDRVAEQAMKRAESEGVDVLNLREARSAAPGR